MQRTLKTDVQNPYFQSGVATGLVLYYVVRKILKKN